MDNEIRGIHHITAMASDAQANIDFYCGVLGLRLVKLTVNFDDPGSYHLYYGDELGRPGSILTFFAWPGAHRGRHGAPQVTVTSFSVPATSLPFWRDRLQACNVTLQETGRDTEVLRCSDPDGMVLELVGREDDERPPWGSGPIPSKNAILGFHHATLSVEDQERTASLLTATMGFRLLGEKEAATGSRSRYAVGAGGPGALVELVSQPAGPRGTMGAGTVHHIAWRARDDAAQLTWQSALGRLGYGVSPVMDRQYFHSVYFREPGGILFEIATDNPGFTTDEPAERLGSGLMLPPWLEASRPQIERIVPPLRLPQAGAPVNVERSTDGGVKWPWKI